ncbi:MAG: hypothetical protein LBP26_00720 [Clostridiales bacterium]|nr:hypothetical protein [Clostridiales bacterium]
MDNTKFWVLCILYIRKRLAGLVRLVDKKVERIAARLYGDTYSQCVEIIRLNDQKALLINLKLLYDALKRGLTGQEFALLESYAHLRSYTAAAAGFGITSTTAMRRLDKTVDKCAVILAAYGYTESRLNRDYSGLAPAAAIYAAYLNRSDRAKKKAPASAELAKKGSGQKPDGDKNREPPRQLPEPPPGLAVAI